MDGDLRLKLKELRASMQNRANELALEALLVIAEVANFGSWRQCLYCKFLWSDLGSRELWTTSIILAGGSIWRLASACWLSRTSR